MSPCCSAARCAARRQPLSIGACSMHACCPAVLRCRLLLLRMQGLLLLLHVLRCKAGAPLLLWRGLLLLEEVGGSWPPA